jgi:hypothetical protein
MAKVDAAPRVRYVRTGKSQPWLNNKVPKNGSKEDAQLLADETDVVWSALLSEGTPFAPQGAQSKITLPKYIAISFRPFSAHIKIDALATIVPPRNRPDSRDDEKKRQVNGQKQIVTRPQPRPRTVDMNNLYRSTHGSGNGIGFLTFHKMPNLLTESAPRGGAS